MASTASDAGSGSAGGHHSRTLSTSDLPRRVAQPILAVKDTVQQRAQALSDCYTLARLATSGVVPAGKPLSALLKLGSGDGTAASEGATPSRERALEAQIKAQLRRAYFDSFRPLFRPGRRAAAWTRLAQDLVHAVVPLIPPRMSADPALYPTSAAATAAGDQTTSMRAAVERDLLSTATASTNVTAEESEEQYLPKLERLVRVLQRLCAPARDPDARAILDKLGAAIVHPAPGTTTTTAASAANTSGDSASAAAAPHQAEQSASALTSSSDLSSTTTQSQSQSHQPDLEVVDFVREILDLAEAMRADLARFHSDIMKTTTSTTTTTLSEQELERVVEREAALRERAVVLEWYGGEEENVRRATRRWCWERSAAGGRSRSAAAPESPSSDAADPTTLLDRATGSREEFALALVETLFAIQPVAVPSLEETPPPPVERNNLLPPPLVVLAPLLFELQNQLQALVILACLATIASSSSSSSSTANSPPDASSLLERLWTILDMNITRRPAAEEERFVPGSSETSAAVDDKEEEEEEDGTRLAHLADEILAHLTTAAVASHDHPSTERAAGPDPDLEKRVRASVDRILRYEDPVWKLFSNRLEGAVKAALLDVIRSETATSPNQVQPQVPAQLRTGRSTSSSVDERHQGGSPLPPLPRTGTKRRAAAAADFVAAVQPVKVKGFDNPAFLADKVSELVRDRLVGEVWAHVEEVWGTILGWTE